MTNNNPQRVTEAMIEAGSRYMSDNGLGIMGNGYLEGLYLAMEAARTPSVDMDEVRELSAKLREPFPEYAAGTPHYRHAIIQYQAERKQAADLLARIAEGG